MTIGQGGVRSSSSTAYLRPGMKASVNLDVLIHAQATRLIQDGAADGKAVFNAVEFSQDKNSTSPIFLSYCVCMLKGLQLSM